MLWHLMKMQEIRTEVSRWDVEAAYLMKFDIRTDLEGHFCVENIEASTRDSSLSVKWWQKE